MNVSGRQLQDPSIVDDVARDPGQRHRPDHGGARDHREHPAARRRHHVERLNALAALGVHLYIDDFGTGYSSLSYLQMLPVNGLKLAQEFVERAARAPTPSPDWSAPSATWPRPSA